MLLFWYQLMNIVREVMVKNVTKKDFTKSQGLVFSTASASIKTRTDGNIDY